MRPIGFSTGALAKGDFSLGLSLQRHVRGITAIELSALREHELPTLVAAVAKLDVAQRFDYVSFHAPSRLRDLTERAVLDMLLSLPERWPIIVHPEIILTPALWTALGSRLCLENMDNRKTAGRTVAELQALFSTLPEATFCLDVGHARQIDPTMTSAILMLRHFGQRLRQVHVSDVGPRGEHCSVGVLASLAFSRLAAHIPDTCPLIIESIIESSLIEQELMAVQEAFERPSSVHNFFDRPAVAVDRERARRLPRA